MYRKVPSQSGFVTTNFTSFTKNNRTNPVDVLLFFSGDANHSLFNKTECQQLTLIESLLINGEKGYRKIILITVESRDEFLSVRRIVGESTIAAR